jgi:ribonuclease T2
VKISGLVAALLLTAAPAIAGGTPGVFDYYVLSLSWSPTYCATNARPNPAECATSRGFIVHGLWPQYESGYPSDCPSNMPRRVKQETVDGIADIMPGAGLVNHEWQTHGLCSGLNQSAYFVQVRSAYRGINLPTISGRTLAPREIEQAFIAANPRMSPAGIAVACRRGLLEEVRICLTQQLAFRPCPEVDRQGCHVPEISVPAP